MHQSQANALAMPRFSVYVYIYYPFYIPESNKFIYATAYLPSFVSNQEEGSRYATAYLLRTLMLFP